MGTSPPHVGAYKRLGSPPHVGAYKRLGSPPHVGACAPALRTPLAAGITRPMPIRNKRTPRPPVSVVTGGAGFLGSHLVDLLLAQGHRVVAIDNLITGSTDNIVHLAGHPAFRFIKQDVTEYLFLDGPVDYVWHFASPASPVDYAELPIQTLKVGSLGTHKALGLAKHKGARFLLASTSEVYGSAVTAKMQVDYAQPLRIGSMITVRASLTRSRPPLFVLVAQVTQDGSVCAKATAKFMSRDVWSVTSDVLQ